jgi:hypothetical protein
MTASCLRGGCKFRRYTRNGSRGSAVALSSIFAALPKCKLSMLSIAAVRMPFSIQCGPAVCVLENHAGGDNPLFWRRIPFPRPSIAGWNRRAARMRSLWQAAHDVDPCRRKQGRSHGRQDVGLFVLEMPNSPSTFSVCVLLGWRGSLLCGWMENHIGCSLGTVPRSRRGAASGSGFSPRYQE